MNLTNFSGRKYGEKYAHKRFNQCYTLDQIQAKLLISIDVSLNQDDYR